MTAADRPSVTDNARAEAERRLRERTHDPSGDWMRGHRQGYRDGFPDGAEWAVERGEAIPDDLREIFDNSLRLATEKHLGAAGRAETTTATVEHAARVLWEHDNALGTTPAWRVSVLRDALAGLLARPTPTRDDQRGQDDTKRNAPEADTDTVARALWDAQNSRGERVLGVHQIDPLTRALTERFHIIERTDR